jgi:hypothetical protein
MRCGLSSRANEMGENPLWLDGQTLGVGVLALHSAVLLAPSCSIQPLTIASFVARAREPGCDPIFACARVIGASGLTRTMRVGPPCDGYRSRTSALSGRDCPNALLRAKTLGVSGCRRNPYRLRDLSTFRSLPGHPHDVLIAAWRSTSARFWRDACDT